MGSKREKCGNRKNIADISHMLAQALSPYF
jgi:hypothetical protein